MKSHRFISKCLTVAFCLVTLSLSPLVPPSLAGPGHDHSHDFPGGHGNHTGGPIVLSQAQRQNLGVQTIEAEIREMGHTVEVAATLVLPPERHGVVSAPFSGRVDEVLVKLGEQINAGDPVLKASPLTVGSPSQTLISPISGHVIRQASVPGATFTPETVLMEIGDDRELLAQGIFFQTPVLTQIKMGTPASLTLDLFPDESFPGVLQRLDTGHGLDDPSFHLYALIPNPDRRLRPNFRGRLSVQIEEPHPVVAVPKRAVLGSLGKLFVFVETDDAHFERREVVVGIHSGDWVEIIEGLLPGERVVTVGNYQMQFVE